MPQYLQRGKLPPKRHIAFPSERGFKNEGIHYEEVVTLAGFGRAYSIVYHLRPPTRVKKIEPAREVLVDLVREPALRHPHLKTKEMTPAGDPIFGRVSLLANADVAMMRCRPATAQRELYRNAECDEVLFIQRGQGTLSSMFGTLSFRP